jgi:hypothetical protein
MTSPTPVDYRGKSRAFFEGRAAALLWREQWAMRAPCTYADGSEQANQWHAGLAFGLDELKASGEPTSSAEDRLAHALSIETARVAIEATLTDRLKAENDTLVKENEKLQGLVAELYQVLGALDAPEHVLDQVSAASLGEPLPHDSLLPFVIDADDKPAPLDFVCEDKGLEKVLNLAADLVTGRGGQDLAMWWMDEIAKLEARLTKERASATKE